MEKEDIYEAMHGILQERARKIEEAGGLEESLRSPRKKVFVALGRKISPDFDDSYLENAIIETYCLVKHPPQEGEFILDYEAYRLSRTYITIHGAVKSGAQNPEGVYDWLSGGIKVLDLFSDEAIVLMLNPKHRSRMFQEYKQEIEPMLGEFAEYCRQRMSTGSPQ